MRMIDLFVAEFLKLKSSLALYFTLLISFLLVGLVVSGHFVDVHSLAELNKDPWNLFINRGETILTAFMIVPFTIFLALALFYIEQKADSKKMLYTMPNCRWNLVLSKVMIYVSLLAGIFLLYGFFMILGGHLLAMFFPEYEFGYYNAPIIKHSSLLLHTFIASLGIVGIQILLHSVFRSYLLPLIIGIIVFMGGFVTSVMNLPITKFNPFTYPIIVRDLNFIPSDIRVLYKDGLFSNLELYSVLVFVFCIVLACLLETRKSVR